MQTEPAEHLYVVQQFDQIVWPSNAASITLSNKIIKLMAG